MCHISQGRRDGANTSGNIELTRLGEIGGKTLALAAFKSRGEL